MMSINVHWDYPPVKGCLHPEWTYGEICVKCGECGRYDVHYECVNCGFTKGKKPHSAYSDWGFVEFFDCLNAPICPKCRPLFKKEDRANYPDDVEKYGFSLSNEIIGISIKDFEPRSLKEE